MRRRTEYKAMYDELERYERNGVSILMDGYSVSPMQVVEAHMTKEHMSYMRDYELDSEGKVESLSFTNINRRRRRYFRPH